MPLLGDGQNSCGQKRERRNQPEVTNDFAHEKFRRVNDAERLSLTPRFSEVIAAGAGGATVLTVFEVPAVDNAVRCRKIVETVSPARVRMLTPLKRGINERISRAR